MALELRIAGPGLDATRRVEAGEPPLILGRDPECSVRLPDPERNVSRRHLSVWNEGDELHFHVLSVINGVEMPFGEAPPGARGVLLAGQSLRIADYSVRVFIADSGDSAAPDSDPWETLDREASGFAHTEAGTMAGISTDADPFGEWGFDTYGSETPSGRATLQASALASAPDFSAFYTGLGLDPAKVGALSQGELEAIGRLVRLVMLGVVDMHKTVTGSKKDMRSEDRTMMAQKEERNPLKEADLSEDTLLQYLFGGRMAAGGFVGPEQALQELLLDLMVHERASAAAARGVAEGALKEFDPEALKTRLLAGGAKLFGSARAWEAYVKYHGEQSETQARWAQRLLDKYFTSTYIRETMRLKRDTGSRQR